MLLLGLLAFGFLAGWLAQILLGLGSRPDARTLVAGLVGSFVGGLLISLLAGDGLELRASGIIGSLVGAIIVTALWRWWDGRNTASSSAATSAKRSGDPRKSHPR